MNSSSIFLSHILIWGWQIGLVPSCPLWISLWRSGLEISSWSNCREWRQCSPRERSITTRIDRISSSISSWLLLIIEIAIISSEGPSDSSFDAPISDWSSGVDIACGNSIEKFWCWVSAWTGRLMTFIIQFCIQSCVKFCIKFCIVFSVVLCIVFCLHLCVILCIIFRIKFQIIVFVQTTFIFCWAWLFATWTQIICFILAIKGIILRFWSIILVDTWFIHICRIIFICRCWFVLICCTSTQYLVNIRCSIARLSITITTKCTSFLSLCNSISISRRRRSWWVLRGN